MDVLQLDPSNAAHRTQFSQVRLRALRTDPAAFGSNYERELAFDDDVWRARLSSFAGHPGAVFAAFPTSTDATTDELILAPAGVVGVGMPEHSDGAIWGMWVAPEGRRRGVAAQLLDAAEAWAVQSGARTATLWVHRTNDAARALYERRGYALVGPNDLPANAPPECNNEICMRLRLALA